MNKPVITALLGILLFWSCSDNENQNNPLESGSLALSFDHFVDGQEVVFNKMQYVNAAGNQYEIREIQYFISDVTLHKSDGSEFVIEKEKFAHYVDTNIPGTNNWLIKDDIPEGNYKSVSMVFGIKGEKNMPLMFTDPPESDMFWPMHLGGEQGGYHYMKLNGFWINLNSEREPFNFHMGVGQERDEEKNITGYIQNWIEIELPNSSFALTAGENKEITIRMNAEQWWENPHVYNHNNHGSKIMHNQEAMRMGMDNGHNVFEVANIKALPAL